MSDTTTLASVRPDVAPLERWNAQSITGGVSADTTPNATVDGELVIAVWVEVRDSDEYAHTYECFFADGTVDYVAPEDVEFGEDD